MSEAKESYNWLLFAREELAAAEGALSRGDRPFRLWCFVAQQAVGKAVKGVLLHVGVEPPKTHSIEFLLTACAKSGIRVDDELKEASDLTAYAVAARYPDGELEVGVAELEAAIRCARRVVDWAESMIGSSGDAG